MSGLLNVLSVSPRVAVVYDVRSDSYMLVRQGQQVAGSVVVECKALRLPYDMTSAIIGLLSHLPISELPDAQRVNLEVFQAPRTDDA